MEKRKKKSKKAWKTANKSWLKKKPGKITYGKIKDTGWHGYSWNVILYV